jgi:hypothetical protein
MREFIAICDSSITERAHARGKGSAGVSVLDDLHKLEKRIDARLAELEPLVEEYQQLQRAAERFGFAVDPQRSPVAQTTRGRPGKAKPRRSTTVPPKQRAAQVGSSRRRPGGTQATGRERRERVLGLIRERPGITVPDISAQLGIDAPSLYRVVRKLQSEGAVRKDGKQLALAG